GKCARLHGHSYTLDISVRGPVQGATGGSDEGMVVDLGEIKRIVDETIISKLDHYNLNDVLRVPSTAENIAHWVWDELEAEAPALAALLWRVRLWETATGFVEITREERP
ncbi:MAG TPA: 6-carboxytetrahydropterin synthase, partial [Herpetosiphonaceae bacterium]